ncbi:hypothetical protein LWI28_007792 [Acer negundo]|uniref:DUF4283 domain-containing protein n=1 Tax=Acer negundo TaxID=4023 RepID=A0AAD5NG47_ACENE|nr:hypothetical protein LWI28_007792 [Acer negundo]
MNAEEIVKLCDALSIKEKNGSTCMLDVKLKDKSENRLALSLVRKVLKKKLVKREIFIDVMNKIWRVNCGVKIEPIEGNIFAFYFSNLEDRHGILNGNGKAITMFLHYERLMDYCFRCDRLGHDMDECVALLEEDRDVSSNANRKLTVWLRA